MFDYSALYRAIRATPLSELAESLPPRVSQQLDSVCHGDLKRWRRCLDRLPGLRRMDVRLDTDWVSVGNRETADDGERRLMTELLQELHPWRKGPFSLHGLRLDAEWRSDRKWARLAPVIAPLDGRRVLDVGCGNGYYGWRMVGAGAGLEGRDFVGHRLYTINLDFGAMMPMELAVNGNAHQRATEFTGEVRKGCGARGLLI